MSLDELVSWLATTGTVLILDGWWTRYEFALKSKTSSDEFSAAVWSVFVFGRRLLCVPFSKACGKRERAFYFVISVLRGLAASRAEVWDLVQA